MAAGRVRRGRVRVTGVTAPTGKRGLRTDVRATAAVSYPAAVQAGGGQGGQGGSGPGGGGGRRKERHERGGPGGYLFDMGSTIAGAAVGGRA
jgi:hypothetical protein